MRVIKFRALKDDMSNVIYLYGNLVYNELGEPSIATETKDHHFLSFNVSACLKNTEGQFVGFLDKNQKEIFEGDILRYDFESDGKMESSYMQIFFNEATAQFCYDDSYKSDKTSFQELTQEFCSVVEVVGDIHLTPELLKPQSEDDEDEEFQSCDECDLPDACSDFGCAIKSGIRKI